MKNKKFFRVKSICMAAVVLGMSVLSGCGQKAGSDKDLLGRIREKGEIVIAMEGTWSPWTYHDENNRLVGFDTEVAQKIAEKLGVKAVFAEGEWDGLLAGLEVGRYDIMANGVEITEERSQKYDFTDPYAYIHTALVVNESNTDINKFEDLKGKKTANSINSTYMYLAEQYGANALGVDTLDQTMDMVLSGRADATLNADVSVYDYLKVHKDAKLRVAALTDEAALVSIPLRKGDDTKTLREAINSAIKEMHESGELSEISKKYFGSDITRNG